MARLTKRVVEAAETRAADYFIWCDDLPGFGARVFASGKRSYLIQYRTNGKSRRAKIGLHGRITVEEARKEAQRMFGEIAKGGDPAEERTTRRQSMTVAELCDRYMVDAGKGLVAGKSGPKKASTLSTDATRIEAHIRPLLGKRLVRELSPVDVARFIRDVTTGRTAAPRAGHGNARTGGAGVAARAAGLLGGILTFAVSEGVITHNPATGVRKPAYKRRTARLDADGYRAFGGALRAMEAERVSDVAIAAARLLALTGCRYAEIIGLQWREVDGAGGALRLLDSKEGASVRPIGRAALDVIEALPRRDGEAYVLPSPTGGKPYGGFRAVWRAICTRAGLVEVIPHTLRHSFASTAADLGMADSTIAAMLGHAAGTVTGRYTHHLDSVLIAAADRVAAEVALQMGLSR